MQLIGNLCRWNIKMQLSISSNFLHPLCCQSSLSPHPFLLSNCIHSCPFPIHHEQGSQSGLWKINMILIPYCPKPFLSFPLILSCGQQGHGGPAPHHVSTCHLLPVHVHYTPDSLVKPSLFHWRNNHVLPSLALCTSPVYILLIIQVSHLNGTFSRDRPMITQIQTVILSCGIKSCIFYTPNSLLNNSSFWGHVTKSQIKIKYLH